MKRLLEKYRRGIISTDELKQLSAGMDAASDSELAGLLEKEWMNENKIIIMVTHDLELAKQCDIQIDLNTFFQV